MIDGTSRALRFAVIKDGMTVSKYLEACAKKDLAWDEFAVEDFVASLRASGRALAACQPRDLIDQIIDPGRKPISINLHCRELRA